MGAGVSVDRYAVAGLILDAAADAASTIFPGTADYLADELLAAGYRKPRTIVTADGLKALPNGAAVRSEQGGVWERQEGQAGSLLWVEATQGRGYPQPRMRSHCRPQ